MLTIRERSLNMNVCIVILVVDNRSITGWGTRCFKNEQSLYSYMRRHKITTQHATYWYDNKCIKKIVRL